MSIFKLILGSRPRASPLPREIIAPASSSARFRVPSLSLPALPPPFRSFRRGRRREIVPPRIPFPSRHWLGRRGAVINLVLGRLLFRDLLLRGHR